MITFKHAWTSFAKNAFNFEGRSSRAAVWWVVLGLSVFSLLVVFLLETLAPNFNMTTSEEESHSSLSSLGDSFRILAVFGLVLIIPLLTLFSRRFFDAGISAVWLGVALVFPLLTQAFLFMNSNNNPKSANALETPSGLEAIPVVELVSFGAFVFILIVLVLPSKYFSKYSAYPRNSF